MKRPSFSLPNFLALSLLVLSISSWAPSAHAQRDFLRCLSGQFGSATSQIVYTPNNPSYLSILQASIQNLVFATPGTPRPLAIITPTRESHVAGAILCARKNNIQIRTRSGGHDFEGLSYASPVPFAVVDMFNLRRVTVNVREKTAWVQTGATLGEVYWNIANKSNTLGFPAGICPTVGTGGHISGGGYGMLVRKYGLAADHVIDARVVNANGRILDKNSMGEDYFWAIRGGGGASFGVVLAWKIELVSVPEIVTVFTVAKTLEQNATQIVDQWQYKADKTDENLLLRIFMRNINLPTGGRTSVAAFAALFLGRANNLLSLMQSEFPEIGVVSSDLREMRWVESALYFINGTDLDYLLNRTYEYKANYKLKADVVKTPMPASAIEGIWSRFQEEDVEVPLMVLTPLGGAMNRVSPSARPYPHRAGNIYLAEYQVMWSGDDEAEHTRHLNWTRELYNYMEPYVSQNPREAYLNYRDLDIGPVNDLVGNVSVARASIWGIKYFMDNFFRLVYVKTLVDPENFFRNEQSIPPLDSWWRERVGQLSLQMGEGKYYSSM